MSQRNNGRYFSKEVELIQYIFDCVKLSKNELVSELFCHSARIPQWEADLEIGLLCFSTPTRERFLPDTDSF